ncbi:MAG: flagellar brake protein [Methylovulum sp.]|nr:flagellar brake protein [Methylovulum sp.]
MQYESAFLIRSPELIISKLAILCKNKCLLYVSFGDSGDSFITTILEVNKKDNTVIFYHGPKKNLLERLYTSANIAFRTEHQGIKINFNGKKMAEIRRNGAPAFTMPVPESLTWMEARDFYRIKIPLSKPSFCLLLLNGQEPVKLKLHDISLTGFSVLNESNKISGTMNPNMHFKNCTIVLTDNIVGVVSFEIRHKYLVNQAHIKNTEKIGCKFTEITPAFENSIQSYILEIEREHRQSVAAEYEARALERTPKATLS